MSATIIRIGSVILAFDFRDNELPRQLGEIFQAHKHQRLSAIVSQDQCKVIAHPSVERSKCTRSTFAFKLAINAAHWNVNVASV